MRVAASARPRIVIIGVSSCLVEPGSAVISRDNNTVGRAEGGRNKLSTWWPSLVWAAKINNLKKRARLE